MAIYHFSVTPISRGSGKSSIASAAYRAGEKLYDERQDRTFDYGRKQGVVYKSILLPEGAPDWMADREKLWNAVEAGERRKDAQLARELQFSLPRELSEGQNIELAREFVQNEFVAKNGMIADLCIHVDKAKDGEDQPHAHVMLTMRKVTESGFGLKERSWNAKENLLEWREAWAEYANRYLALNDIEQRIDHRTLVEQGIILEPQKKIGREIPRIRDLRLEEHQRIARENGEKIFEDPIIALKAITYHQSTFTHQDLARFINRHTIDAEQFQAVYEKVKSSEQIVSLSLSLSLSPFLGFDPADGYGLEDRGKDKGQGKGKGKGDIQDRGDIDSRAGRDGRKSRGSKGKGGVDGTPVRFTTKEMLDLERGMLKDAVELKGRHNAFITPRDQDLGLGDTSLSLQQEDALKHIIGAGDLKCLVGYAGTGKSMLLSEAREIWEENGYRVHGATLSGIAAENLEAASGIESRTLASRCYYWGKGEEKLAKKDILVIDEAGMLGSRQIARILKEVMEGKAKVVLIGDPQQLQAIEAGAAFRAIVELVGYFELTEVKRQQELWQQEATKEFALQNTKQALSRYEQHGYIHVFETQAEAKQALVKEWNDMRISQPDKNNNKTQIMLAYTRRDAQELNEMARSCRKDRNELLSEDIQLQVASGSKPFAINDRIYFLRNDRFLGVKNGSLGVIENIDIYGKTITAKLDRDDLDGNARVVTFSLDQYNHIDHGYAATIHKAQAITVDDSHVLASKHLDSHSAYVGMTRHKETVHLYWSKEEFTDQKELQQVLSRDRSKDVTLDYIYPNPSLSLTETKQEQETVHVFYDDHKKNAPELVAELVKLGGVDIVDKAQKTETRTQSYVRVIKELNQKAEMHPDTQQLRQELKELHRQEMQERKEARKEKEIEIEVSELRQEQEPEPEQKREPDKEKKAKVVDENHVAFITSILPSKKEAGVFLTKHYGKEKAYEIYNAAIEQKEQEERLRQERRAEVLLNKYFRLEGKHAEFALEGKLPFAEAIMEEMLSECAGEICKNKSAMEYLEENRPGLFKELSELKDHADNSEPSQRSLKSRVNEIIKTCTPIIADIDYCNLQQERYIRQGAFSHHLKNCMIEYKDKVMQCVKDNGNDINTLDSLRQRDGALFRSIDKATDNMLTEAFEDYESAKQLEELAGNRTVLYEKTLFGEREYKRLEQEYLGARQAVAEMFTHGYGGWTECKEFEAIKKSAEIDLGKHAREICRDTDMIRLISQHDQKLFNSMNDRFDNMFKEAITRDNPLLSNEKRTDKIIDNYYAIEERYQTIREHGGSRFDEREAKDQLERCTHEIYKNRQVMEHLHENDRELFDKMRVFKETFSSKEQEREKEKVIALQHEKHEKQRGFEMEMER